MHVWLCVFTGGFKEKARSGDFRYPAFLEKAESNAIDKQKFMEKAKTISNGFRPLNKKQDIGFQASVFFELGAYETNPDMDSFLRFKFQTISSLPFYKTS
ncbi:hypothetical protein M9Y82_01855 [Leptospira weilii]|uniref:hypothetical protein n=1 Tax=Leptospira weilii TaxID=28184 RepID=UPI000A767AFB|nr:hypothetical protein [Leptospira weilii]MCL8265415.1 hypothetical protein [Leptospira weilii]